MPVQLRRLLRVLWVAVGACVLTSSGATAQDNNASSSRGGSRTARHFVEPGAATGESGGAATPDALPVFVVPPQQHANPSSDPFRFQQEQMIQEMRELAVEPQPIYFPPAPPVLGAPLPGAGFYADDVVRALAPFVAEPFYAPLSTRLAEEDLGRRVRSRLDDYQSEKAALVADLRAQLAAYRHKPADERRRALEELAGRQEVALAALEEAADELRRECFRTRFFGGGGDWNQFRAWRLDPADRARDNAELRWRELRVLRAAVYYQEGLSGVQRRLLREIVMQQAAALQASGAGLGLPPNEPARVIFFSPETARLPLPASLPAELEAMIADYTERKDALKEEIRERLVQLDADRNATRRARALQDFAGEQTVRLADLEVLADEIREKLAPLYHAQTPGAPPSLPGALEGRVAAYLREKSELHRVAQERLARALAELERDEAKQKSPSATRADHRAALVRSTIEAFNTGHAAEIAALNAEAEAIRSELARHAATRPGATAEKSVDALLREFGEALKRQQLATLYTDYRAAVLEPGLSPAQRRLLFDAAIADLKLPGAIRDQQVTADERMSRP